MRACRVFLWFVLRSCASLRRSIRTRFAAPYLQLPTLDARIPQLAATVTKGATNDYDKAANIERYLSTRYGYTLDLSGPPSPIPWPISCSPSAPRTRVLVLRP